MAVAKSIAHYIVSSMTLIFVHNCYFKEPTIAFSVDSSYEFSVAALVLLYWCGITLWRLFICTPTIDVGMHHQAILYETTWMCNTTLFLPSLVLIVGQGRTKYSTLILGHLMAVSIDQVLWYVDLIGCFIYWLRMQIRFMRQGKSKDTQSHVYFIVGVAAYLVWPQTNWKTRITCTHHLWTIPLFLHVLFRNPTDMNQFNRFSIFQSFTRAYSFSMVVIAVNVCLSRWLTPPHLSLTTSGHKSKIHREPRYLNVNLAHDVWKDIKKFPYLRITQDAPSAQTYLTRLLCRWFLLNGLISFTALYPYCIYLYVK